MKKTLSFAIITLIVFAAMPVFAGGAADGAALYKAKCAMCHGPDGKKVNKAMNIVALTSEDVQKKSDADLVKVTTDGKGKMPAYKAKMSADEIAAVVAHIRALAKK